MSNPPCIPAAARRIRSGGVPGTGAVLRHFFNHLPDGFSSPGVTDNRRPSPHVPAGAVALKKGRRIPPFSLLALLCTLLWAASATGAETVINTARADYSIGSVPMVAYSSAATLLVRTPSTLEYLKYAPLSPDAEKLAVATTKYLDSSGSFIAMAGPVPAGATSPLDLSKPLPLVKANVYQDNEPLFLRLADGDQNINPTVAETILLTLEIKDNGEKEELVLTETAPDTGIFTGYVQAAITPSVINGDGVLSVHEGARIIAAYVDIADRTDTAEAAALIASVRTALYLTKAASKDIVSIGDFLQYKITVKNSADIDINAIQVSDRLPLGFRYRAGSTKIRGAAAPDPAVASDGRTLTFDLGSLGSGKTADITYVVEIAAGARIGKAINLATATGSGGVVSNTAGAEVLVKEDLFASKTIILGRVFPGCDKQSSGQSSPDAARQGADSENGVAGVRIYLEDGTYAVTDKQGLYHFEGLKPGTHVVQLDVDTIPEDYELIACEENDRFAGTPWSQFVDLQGGTMWRADFHAIRKAGAPPEETAGAAAGEKPGNVLKSGEEREERKAGTIPEFDNAWLGGAEPGLAFAWPHDGFHPAIPSVKIAVKHDPGKKLKLLLNGKEVDSLYFDGTTRRIDNRLAVSLWIGIHLQDGDNLFEAVEFGRDGNEEQRTGLVVHYSGPPVKVELVSERSSLTADGKTPSVVAVRLLDKEGHPAREGIIGEYRIDPPHQPLQKFEDLRNDPLTMSKSDKLQYVVGGDGLALIELQPTSRTGEATLRFNLVNGEYEVRPWLTPGERDWIVVGLAEGTVGYNTVSDNMESLADSDVDDNYYKDGRLAFFAKGMIKGKWLLTVAYDNARNGNIRNNDSLHRIINPNQYYTLYGDATQQGYDAASARSLYIKLEKDKSYALFGDFETGLTVTELSRYSRNLNGLKSAMQSERFDFNAFASDTNQAFVKDEIRGDGTSGLYRLSRKNIVMNSESITVETRDRFRSEVIISSRRLSRYIDYSIDYETGSIHFKSPVFSRDENFNPIFIVADYESFDPTDMSYIYGGRGAVRFMDNRLEVGATHVHEGSVGGDGNLEGFDATLTITDTTTLKTEVAVTDTDLKGWGQAYLAALAHRSEKLEGEAYIREQDEEFGLGQQNGSETGTRKLGLDTTYHFNDKVSAESEAYRQYNLSADAVRDLAEARGRYTGKKYDIHGGLRHAEDNLGNGETNRSEQITAGGSLRLMDDRLSLMVDHDQSLLSNANIDFPTRTTLGADYQLNETAALFGAQEFTWGEHEDTATSRIGMRASPWSGGQVTASTGQQYRENGARLFAVAGLQQTYKINDQWSVDGGMERSSTLHHSGNDRFNVKASPFNVNVPPSSGGEDFTAVSAGTSYKEKKWTWTARIEARDSDTEDKTGVFSGVYGEYRKSLGLAAALQAFRTEQSSGAETENGNLRFGLAYRPKETRWIVLDRLDFLIDKQHGTGLDFDSRRIINNLNANYKPNHQTQLSLQYGAKYVQETMDRNDYSGYTDLAGLEGRYDVTKKWDIGLRGKVLHSWSADQLQYGLGASVGYSLVKNVWLSVGYNFTGFTDRDFSRADFTAKGFFVKFRMKFDQESIRDAVQHFTGQ